MKYQYKQLTAEEEIASHYNALLDSVNLIKSLNDLALTRDLSEEELDTKSRNVEHCKIMLTRDFWTTEDLTEVIAVTTA